MNAFDSHQGHIEACEICGTNGVHKETLDHEFKFGEATLKAKIPVWVCDECEISYTAEGAEEIERAAVCAHLGRLTPAEIVSHRTTAGLSQEAFARELGIGRVTLARWETGKQLQSAVYDGLIRSAVEQRQSRAKIWDEPRFRTNVAPRRPAARAFSLIAAA